MSICPLTKADSHNGLPHKSGAEVDVAKIGVDYLFGNYFSQVDKG